MKNKNLNKEEIFKIIRKERILSISISLIIAFGIMGGIIYSVNKRLIQQEYVGLGDIAGDINRDAIYRGIINLQSEEESESKRETASGVKDGFDKYEDSKQVFSSNSEIVNSSGNSLVGEGINNNSNNIVARDNSSITGINAIILEGQEFNPIKDLKLRATDINGEDISNKITIAENTVDVYTPGQYIVKAVAQLSNKSQKELLLTVNVQPVNLNLRVNKFEAVSKIVNKGENAILDLELYSSKDYVSALSVNISGIDYPVKEVDKRNKSKKYTLEIPVGDEEGKVEYKLSSIRMSDNTVVIVGGKTNIIVAKDKPRISIISYEESSEQNTSKVIIKLGAEDEDKSILNQRIWAYVYDENNNLITSRQVFLGEYNFIRFTATENGNYTIKVIADLDLYGDTLENEEIFTSIIEVNAVDKSDLIGQDIKISLGEEFNAFEDLKLKAIDVDGTDITDKIIIEGDSINTNNLGQYIVKALVVNKKNKEIIKEFTVEVIDSIVDRILRRSIVDNNNKLIDFKYDSIDYSEYKNGNITIGGDDNETFKSDLIIEGNVLNGNGVVPSGKIEVELPIKAAFSVDKDGKFIGSKFNISNKSACPIKLAVVQFIEEDPNGGITINNSIDDFNTVGRTTISLQLNAITSGNEKKINLDKNLSNEELITVGSGDSATIYIEGKAGTNKSVKEDENGAVENFTVRFRIKKA